MSDEEIITASQGSKDGSSTVSSSLSLSIFSELIKSKQTFLLLYTAVFAYLISAWTTTGIVVSTFFWLNFGVFLAISGSTLLNMVIDSDIDAMMERTRNRPVPSGRIPSSSVLKYGITFTFVGVLSVGIFINLVTMIAVFLGFFFDVVIYSLWLKRKTRYSIIFGGIAGSFPSIAGRAAAIATVDFISISMAVLVLCWIPLHILSLALIPKNLQGYTDAKVPMWPVVTSKEQTIRVISISAILSSIAIGMTGILLETYILLLLPLILFSSYVIVKSFLNLKQPTDLRTFKIFTLASMFMVFTFFWLFIGVVVSTYSVCPLRIIF
jgi:protoheme IX farnesyltransferase